MSSTLAARRLTPLALALALAGALSLPAAHAAPHQGSDAITTSRPSQIPSSERLRRRASVPSGSDQPSAYAA